jgi:uncharacterized protein (TIGR02217 family)
MFETEFPTAVSFLAQGGPAFSTTVNEGFSGIESRNQNWSMPRGSWSIDLSYKPQSYYDDVQAFFLVVGGQWDSFRFKDHKDFTATGQVIGYGDGTTKDFQLTKTYFSGDRSYVRIIRKPITANVLRFDGTNCTESVVIHVGSTLKTLTTDYTVDETTGLVSFLAAPAATSPPTPILADFQFHYAVRFADDALKAQLEEGGSISWTQITVRECKQP